MSATKQDDVAEDNIQHSSSAISLSKQSVSSSETVVVGEMLEVHPGSPLDLSNRRRPSFAAAMAAQQSHFNAHVKQLTRLDDSRENGIVAEGVVAKSGCECEYLDTKSAPRTRISTAATQPFFIPAKVPEQLEIHSLPSPSDDGMSLDGSVDSALDFDFQEENGVWISAIPRANDLHSSFVSCHALHNTLAESKLIPTGGMIESSLAFSGASTLSSSASLTSGTTNCSDVYGWEEELDRKSSMDLYSPLGTESFQRRLPSGGRTPTMYVRNESLTSRQIVGKRKSLLHRVLNMSRRDLDDPVPITTRLRAVPASMN